MRKLVHTLRGNHVLTLNEIKKRCWAAHWPERDFTTALNHAIAAGDINSSAKIYTRLPSHADTTPELESRNVKNAIVGDGRQLRTPTLIPAHPTMPSG